MIDRYEGVELPEGCTFRERDTDVAYHGGDEMNRTAVAPGRWVINVPGREWLAASPEVCGDISQTGEWISDGEHDVLVCRGCGLDCT